MVKRKASPWDHAGGMQVTVHDTAAGALEATGIPAAEARHATVPAGSDADTDRQERCSGADLWDLSYEPLAAALRRIESKITAKSPSCRPPTIVAVAATHSTRTECVADEQSVTAAAPGKGSGRFSTRNLPPELEVYRVTKNVPEGICAAATGGGLGGRVQAGPCDSASAPNATCGTPDVNSLSGHGQSQKAAVDAVADSDGKGDKFSYGPGVPQAVTVQPILIGADLPSCVSRKHGFLVPHGEVAVGSSAEDGVPNECVAASTRSVFHTAALRPKKSARLPSKTWSLL